MALLVMEQFYNGLRQGRPTAVGLRDAQVYVRAMTGRDLAETIARWRATQPDLAEAMRELPVVPPEHFGTPLYSDPFYWAPFMVIGRS